MKTLIRVLLILLTLYPVKCYATKINYDEAKLTFEIDETFWKPVSLDNKNDIIDRKWESDCGVTIMTGVWDLLKDNDYKESERKNINYKTLFSEDNYLKRLSNEYESIYGKPSISQYSDNRNGIKMIKLGYDINSNNITGFLYTDATINNGYGFIIQGFYPNKTYTTEEWNYCVQNWAFNDIVETISVKEDSLKNDKANNSWMNNLILKLILGIVITIIGYEIFPFISVVLYGNVYNKKEVTRMAFINSIVVGTIFMVITFIMNEKIVWSPLTAFLYFFN
jgi:hypothetical protein